MCRVAESAFSFLFHPDAVLPSYPPLLVPSSAQLAIDSFNDDSYSSVSSHPGEEAEEANWSCREESTEAGSVADEKNVEGVGVRPAAIRKKTVPRTRKRTCH